MLECNPAMLVLLYLDKVGDMMGRRKRDGLFWESAISNNVRYRQYLDRLTELAISMWDYENMPDSVDVRYLELTLCQFGQAVFFKDEVLGYLCLKNACNGYWDIYNTPMKRRAYATNGYQKELNMDNSVIIFNNMLRTNTLNDIRIYARRIAELDGVVDVNCKAQKTPVLIRSGEKERLTMMNLYKEYDGNQPFIFGDKSLNPDFTVLRTEAPFVADKIYALKTQVWNEALTYLGVSNINFQKKERMVLDEVIRNMGGTIASRYSRLEARRTAIDKINKMFGLNIKVSYREDYRESDDILIEEGDTGDNGVDKLVKDLRGGTNE